MLHIRSFPIQPLVYILLVAFILGMLVAVPGVPAHAQAPPAQLCYVVADLGDALWQVDPLTGLSSRIGSLGGSFTNVEAIALNLDSTILYGAHDDGINGIFGAINTTTGAFSAIGAIGPANGVDPTTGTAVTAALTDVDSLSIHPLTGDMWGITQDASANKIFRINTGTGTVIPDTFGPGLDYVQIVLPAALTDVDDLGIDPVTGEFYFVANNNGGNDFLYRLNINGFNPPASPGLNATQGTITSVAIGQFALIGSPGTNITDMEGFAFYNDGTFYGTTGNQSIGGWGDRMWEIDTGTGQVTYVTPNVIDNDGIPPANGDFEAVGCLSAGSNIKTGIVFEDLDFNGVFDGADTPYAGATVYFYRDNGNGVFDGSPTDTLIQTAVTDAGGVYRFEVAVEGTFFAVVDLATLPVGTNVSTAESYTVNFVNFSNNLINNNFGFGAQPPPPPPPPPDPDPTVTPVPTTAFSFDPENTPAPTGRPLLIKYAQPSTVLPGELVTFTITATNPTASAINEVLITDSLDATFFDAVLEVSTTKGTAVITGPLSITANIGTLAPGEAVTVTLIARVRDDITGPKSTENVAIMVSREHAPVEARAAVALVTLPSTGYTPDSPADSSITNQTILIALAVTLLGTFWVLRRRAAR